MRNEQRGMRDEWKETVHRCWKIVLGAWGRALATGSPALARAQLVQALQAAEWGAEAAWNAMTEEQQELEDEGRMTRRPHPAKPQEADRAFQRS
jgi:hypothetical protein